MNKAKYSKRTVLRLMKYIVGIHPFQFACVCVAIIISALANIASPLFLMILVDDYITPMVESGSTDFTAMWQTVALMGAVYLVGVLCTYIYNRLMVNIGQGVQRKIRDDAFTKMQSLPISFFDTHTHGEIMSVYTNDIDTLRQLISQSIPQMFSSFVTAVTTFVVMVLLSWQLSFISIVMIVLMFFVARFFASRSSRNFIAQQKNLGKVNGYIEEIMSGQKVVKVFNHEEEAIDGFKTLNEELCKSATDANRFANVVMPCIANIGNLQFVITAIIGGIAFVSGAWGLTIGALVSYMQFTRSFNHPFALISQQFNSVAMALAGAERIFNLMDQKPEDDDGTVTLANVTENADGTLAETDKHTGLWAWKYVDEQGKTYYRRLAGFVEFRDVSFGYTDGKTILKHISLTALPGQKVAFVGATGAGKTTITNLINRFYDVTQGQIIYDGIDVKSIRKEGSFRYMGSDIFFHSLAEGETCEVKLGEGRVLIVKLQEVRAVDNDGMREAIFEVNGNRRIIKIKDKTVTVNSSNSVLYADESNPLEVGANIPGNIIKVLVKEGEKVEANQPIAVIEAMKMETNILAAAAGTVERIYVSEGQQVKAGEMVAKLK